jgi:predicted O-methyltransferase YrrM
MGRIVPDAIEKYLADLNRGPDALLLEIAQKGVDRNLPLVDAEVGALLRVLVLATAATKVLEIGTAVGYSGIWLAGALPSNGMLLTVEMNPERAREARSNFDRAGLSDRVNVIVGDAERMVAKVAGPFDLIFQDGDKKLYEPLLDRLVTLLRPRGLLVTDNVLWDGKVVPGFAKAPADDEDTRAIASYNRRVTADPRLLTTILPIRDGVSISVKRS